MRLLALLSFLLILAEFRADVSGRPTIIGCYFRGLDNISDDRCNP